MTNENISVQNDVETIEIATTDIDVKEEIVDTEVTTNVENEQKAQDDDYLLVVNDLKEYFPISKSLIKRNTVYLKAVDGVSLKLKAGHTIGIVGESGCGKTTLGRTILRLYEPTGGEVIFEGKHIEKLKGNALRKMRPNFQMIFQDPYSSLSPRMTVGEIVGEAVKVHHIVLSAGLVIHPQHVSCEYAEIEIVDARLLPEELSVLVPPFDLILLPEVRSELLPGCGDQWDTVALHHVEEHLPLLPLGVVLLVVVPVAENEGYLDIEVALFLLVHDGFQEIAGSGTPSCGEPT